jgi:hypothetical protein
MKHLLLLILAAYLIASCQTNPANNKKDTPVPQNEKVNEPVNQPDGNTVELFNEQHYNMAREIKSYQNKLYLFGQRISKNDGADFNSCLVVMDTSLHVIREHTFGGNRSGIEERLVSFEIDDKGNTYLAGKKDNKGEIIKCDANGKITWQKEFGNGSSPFEFQKICRSGNEFYLVGSENGGAVVLKTDLNGNKLWSKNTGAYSPACGLHVIGDMIIFISTALDFAVNDGLFLRTVCLDRNGLIKWTKNITGKESMIDKGTKYINSTISADQKSITIFCNSQNPLIADFSLVTIDLIGELNLLTAGKAYDIPECKEGTDILLCYDHYSTTRGRIYAKLWVTTNNSFCRVPWESDYDLIDYTIINNTKYFIGNRINESKFLSSWIITK